MTNLSTNPGYPVPGATVEARTSAVSWAAVIAGAFAAAATTLILLEIGTGFGLASVSPWSHRNPSATTVAVGAIIWLIVVQWIASGLGGYLTGRLRTRWTGTHTHEVFFRDTAHGFLTWALVTVIGVAVVATAGSSLLRGGARAGATMLSGAAQGAGKAGSIPALTRDYDLDSLFRTTRTDMTGMPEARSSASRILAMAATGGGDVSSADRGYLADLVAARTGVTPADAQKRVGDVLTAEKAAEAKARQAADDARKAAAKFAIVTAISMLIGAFIACAAASLGGQERDLHP